MFHKTKRFKKRKKQTNLERFGVPNAMQSEEIKQKVVQTNLKQYGTEYGFQSEEVKNKIKQTNLERYGFESAAQSEVIKAKIIKTFGINNGMDNLIINDIVLQIFGNDIKLSDIYSNNELFTKLIINMYKIKNELLRLKEISNIFDVNDQIIHKRLKTLNLEQYFSINDYDLQLQFKNMLDNNNITYIRHDRTILNPKEIDFIINDNIGIEINDIGTHNIMKKDSKYHINKTISAKEKGIRLIHLWEWELVNSTLWSRLSGWIVNLCNNHKIKIGARKCIIKEVSLEEEKKFLNQYHLQGYMKSEVCYGLYYDNDLIQLMSFSIPRYNKNYQYELLRLCTKYGYIVIGGANKLLDHFIKFINPLSIISYCDLSKFTGKIYEELGFKLLKQNQPSAIWYNSDDGKYFSQSSLNMIGADKLLGTNYGKGTNNEEIVYRSGYKKIYNCGLNVYVYN